MPIVQRHSTISVIGVLSIAAALTHGDITTSTLVLDGSAHAPRLGLERMVFDESADATTLAEIQSQRLLLVFEPTPSLTHECDTIVSSLSGPTESEAEAEPEGNPLDLDFDWSEFRLGSFEAFLDMSALLRPSGQWSDDMGTPPAPSAPVDAQIRSGPVSALETLDDF